MSEEIIGISSDKKKKDKEDRKYWIITRVGVPLMLVMYAYNEFFPEECVSKAQVVDILSVEGNKATFLFSNGKKEQLSYANLKRGDTQCLAIERKNKYF